MKNLLQLEGYFSQNCPGEIRYNITEQIIRVIRVIRVARVARSFILVYNPNSMGLKFFVTFGLKSIYRTEEYLCLFSHCSKESPPSFKALNDLFFVCLILQFFYVVIDSFKYQEVNLSVLLLRFLIPTGY